PAPVPPVDPTLPEPFHLEDVVQRVVFRFQIGYAIDQGEPVKDQPLPADVRGTRLYTFGDAAVGANGLLGRSVSPYFAAHYLLDAAGATAMAAVPSAFDSSSNGRALLIRSAYAELSDVGPAWLAPLHIRAGRQFRYGIAVTQFDGISVEYATPAFAFEG